MPEVKSVSVRISVTGAEDAKLKIDRVAVAAEKLKAERPELTPKIDAQKALMEARLLRAGINAEFKKAIDQQVEVHQSFVNRIGGLFSKGLTGAAGGLGGIPFAGGALGPIGSAAASAGPLASGAALAGVGAAGVAAIGAALPLIGALASGLTAATLGVSAFGAVAIPTFLNVKEAYTAINAAQDAYNKAVEVQKLDPTKQHAKDVATALLNLKAAQDGVTGSTKTAIAGIGQLSNSFGKLAQSVQPTVMKVFNDGLKIANSLLPALKPLATAAGGAIDGLLKKFLSFTQSGGFKDWLTHIGSLVGPAITALGTGIGHVVSAIGTLFQRFSARDVAHAITVVFDTITVAIRWTINVIGWLMTAWDRAWPVVTQAVLRAASVIVGSLRIIGMAILDLLTAPIHAIRKLADTVGIHTFDGLDNALQGFRNNFDNTMGHIQWELNQTASDLSKRQLIAHIDANIQALQQKIAKAKQELKDPNLTNPQKTKLQADISQAEAQIARLKAQLASIQNKTVTVAVHGIVSGIGNFAGAAAAAVGRVVRSAGGGGGSGSAGHPVVRASGGWASGLTWVGEQGPELLYTPPGSYVYNNQQARQMAGGTTYNIHVHALNATRDTGRLVVEAIRQFEQGSGHGWRK